eukprot:TRINITY_DN31408_c0_g1_i1.p1 TRINITY_DN31408_c0_g1~~TRINITY_DN31408_c0_g1_i1.p1  ORF type:complete len:672 (+),score=70.62 TRINITY_DN31408_c0_g1_i1:79-2016(+)
MACLPMLVALLVLSFLVAYQAQVHEEEQAEEHVLLQRTSSAINPLQGLMKAERLLKHNLTRKEKFKLYVARHAIVAYMKRMYADSQMHQYETSSNETLPLEMVEQVDFSKIVPEIGSTSYLGILLPDFFKKVTYIPYTKAEYSFLMSWQAELDVRVGEFVTMQVSTHYLNSLEPVTFLNGATYHDIMLKIADEVNNLGKLGEPSLSFVQGNDGKWKADEFAGQYIGHSFMACLLERTSSGDFVLDLSGNGTSTKPMQLLKRKAVALVPHVLLKTRGFLRQTASGLSLVKVEVLDPETGVWMSFDPTASETQWTLAKMALFAEALYVVECYHTGFHLFAGTVTSAIKMSVPPATALGSMVAPNMLQTIFALLEQAALLHSDHNSAFDGVTWPTDNITAIWAVTMDMARFYLDSSPADILSVNASSPAWWAGMSAAFIEPISKFAASVAGQVANQSKQRLEQLQAQLQSVGILTSAMSLDVTTVTGLTVLLRNLLFVAGICHTHMYALRENFTPLVGWVSTQEFLPYMKSKVKGNLPLKAVLIEAFPDITIDSRMATAFPINYGTTSGFGLGVPQLGDGPYVVIGDSATEVSLNESISDFRASLEVTRDLIYKAFGNRSSIGWVPEYFYPVDVPKAFGNAITQTTYI